MISQYNFNLGIINQKKIIEALNNNYALDYKDYSMTAFRNRINAVMSINNLNIDLLISEIETNPNFKIKFLHDFQIPETELFRDPSVWRDITSIFLSKINKPNYKIWLPDFTTGDEIFTLAIILKELNLTDKVKVFISSNSHTDINEQGFGIFPEKHFNTDQANYKRYKNEENACLQTFFNLSNNNYIFDKKLISNFKFTNKNITESQLPKTDLIIYRNKLIYFNLSYQDKILKLIYESLLSGGILAIGTKETIEYNTIKDYFKPINKQNKIYKKIK